MATPPLYAVLRDRTRWLGRSFGLRADSEGVLRPAFQHPAAPAAQRQHAGHDLVRREHLAQAGDVEEGLVWHGWQC